MSSGERTKEVWARHGFKAKMSAAMKKAYARPEVRARHSAAWKKALARPEVRAKKSAASKRMWADPGFKARMSAAMKKVCALAAQGHAPYESSLERRVVKYCKARGWLCLKMDPRYYKGIPDRLIVLPSMVVWMEFKRPDGKGSVSRHQVKAHQTLERLGMYVIVVANYEAALRAMGA